MRFIKRISAIIGLALGSAYFAFFARAAEINTNLQPIGSITGLGSADIRTIVARIIYVALGLLGTILLVIIIYAGFLWMTAGGDEEKVSRAKNLIKNGIIGLIIILASYAITYFVITRLMGAIGGTGGPGQEQAVVRHFGDYGTGSLGEGIIQSHYPAPGQTDVARNTKIIVTFKVAIDPATIISNGVDVSNPNRPTVYTGDLNLSNVRLVASADLASGGAFQTSSDKLVAGIKAYTADNKTFVFAPAKYLGSPSEDVSYTMALGSGIKLADGSAAFIGNYAMGYHWEFATGTTIDVTPPRVIDVVPSLRNSDKVARNIVISIYFNEAVDPTSATGVYTSDNLSFSNVTVSSPFGRVQGTWEPGNQYRAIAFHSNEKGGTNSCGDDVYVLPANAKIDVTALAATVGDAPPVAAFYPPDGITDLASNSLDGNDNGKADDPPADNVSWSFQTSDVMDLTPPRMVSTDPGSETGNADLGKPVGMIFSKLMDITTLSNKNLIFDTLPKLPLWYFGEGVNLKADGTPVKAKGDRAVRTEALIVHERLAPTAGVCSEGARKNQDCVVDADCGSPAVCAKTVFNYYPKAASGVTDVYQNCFLPTCGDQPDKPYCCGNDSGGEPCTVECAINPKSGQLSCPQ